MLRALLAAIALFAAPAAAQDAPENRAVLDAFFAAFNAHDIEAMTQHVTPGIEIVYLGESGIEGRTDGIEALAASMHEYFESLPSARSEILAVIEDGPRLAVRERASWTGRNGTQLSQTALSVYRFENGRIASVWYFPASRD